MVRQIVYQVLHWCAESLPKEVTLDDGLIFSGSKKPSKLYIIIVVKITTILRTSTPIGIPIGMRLCPTPEVS